MMFFLPHIATYIKKNLVSQYLDGHFYGIFRREAIIQEFSKFQAVLFDWNNPHCSVYKSKFCSSAGFRHTSWIHLTPYNTRWLYAFGTPYVLQCYMAIKRVRRRKLLETPWIVGGRTGTVSSSSCVWSIIWNVCFSSLKF